MKPLVTVGLSSLSSRILNSKFHLTDDLDFELVICIQLDQKIKNKDNFKELIRNHLCNKKRDIKICFLEGLGVAKSRNQIMKLTQTPILWFVDDDIEILPFSVREIENDFHKRPNVSLICYQSLDNNKQLRKKFAKKEHYLNKFNSAKYATFEMVLKLDNVIKSNVRFNSNFGAGTHNYFGDEYIFISDLLEKGFNLKYIPRPLCIHGSISSGFYKRKNKYDIQKKVLKQVFGNKLAFFIFRLLRLNNFISNFYKFLRKFCNKYLYI